MDKTVLEEKSWFHLWGLSFTSKLDWDSYIISIVKGAFKKTGASLHSVKFLSPELVFYLYKSTIRPCIEYCCHVWSGAGKCYLNLLDKLQWHICTVVGPELSTSLQSLVHCWDVASLSLFYWYYFSRYSFELSELVLLPNVCGCSTRYSNMLNDFVVIVRRSLLIAFFLEWLSFGALYLVIASLWLIIWRGSRPMLTGT